MEPGARSVFVNELGNRVAITVARGTGPNEVVVSIVGPHSETHNTITQTEAIALYRLLGAYLR